MTELFKRPVGTVTISKFRLRSPSGAIVHIGPTDSFVRIGSHGTVLTTSMVDILNASGRIPSYELPCPDGFIRTTVNGVTIEHPDKPSPSAQAAFAVAVRTIVSE